MWDLPRPGLEPVSPALAGRFSTTAPPGKPPKYFLKGKMHHESIVVLTIQFKIKDFSLTHLVSVFVSLFTYSEIIIPEDMNITIYG